MLLVQNGMRASVVRGQHRHALLDMLVTWSSISIRRILCDVTTQHCTGASATGPAPCRGKARRTELESQLLVLKEEDAALRALAAMTELDTGSTAGACLTCRMDESLLMSRALPAEHEMTATTQVSAASGAHRAGRADLHSQPVCREELCRGVLCVTARLSLQRGFGRC